MLKKSRPAPSLYSSASHGQKSRSKKPPAHRHAYSIGLRTAPLIPPRRSNQPAARPETLSHSAKERP
ncbi:hypothetical protein M2262_005073 [Pseudomonas sp. BIGb0408]|uniref:Uncharacterized protein n=1 Tax=Phytopseudomonas flavescens TaxID=29435 RepID=A0A7Y9XQS8_9GAMM|nr:hypothetical protein [Pseudomonas sp. BIGb0408]NYH75703.1 hypothetical protein [Pseudomonas flavescens]